MSRGIFMLIIMNAGLHRPSHRGSIVWLPACVHLTFPFWGILSAGNSNSGGGRHIFVDHLMIISRHHPCAISG